jgi:hypothetical protein
MRGKVPRQATKRMKHASDGKNCPWSECSVAAAALGNSQEEIAIVQRVILTQRHEMAVGRNSSANVYVEELGKI